MSISKCRFHVRHVARPPLNPYGRRSQHLVFFLKYFKTRADCAGCGTIPIAGPHHKQIRFNTPTHTCCPKLKSWSGPSSPVRYARISTFKHIFAAILYFHPQRQKWTLFFNIFPQTLMRLVIYRGKKIQAY